MRVRRAGARRAATSAANSSSSSTSGTSTSAPSAVVSSCTGSSPKSKSLAPVAGVGAEARAWLPDASAQTRSSASVSSAIMRYLAGGWLGPVRQRHRARRLAGRAAPAGGAGVGGATVPGRRRAGGRRGAGTGPPVGRRSGGGRAARGAAAPRAGPVAAALDRRLGLFRAEDAHALGGRRLGSASSSGTSGCSIGVRARLAPRRRRPVAQPARCRLAPAHRPGPDQIAAAPLRSPGRIRCSIADPASDLEAAPAPCA